ncbi:transposable element Tcb1 transposase [Trichonephila clavipes]|nr:transposable element Tcb1 transposase [Trichonephila clavipes]
MCMISRNDICCRSCNGSQKPFSTRQCSASHAKGVTRLSPRCYYPSLAYPIPRFVSNRAYLGSLLTGSWSFHEFERTTGKVTENMERNVSRHHTELVCLNARSYRIGARRVLNPHSFAFFSKINYPFSLIF